MRTHRTPHEPDRPNPPDPPDRPDPPDWFHRRYRACRRWLERHRERPWLTTLACLTMLLLLAWFLLVSGLSIPQEFIYNQF